jgi:sugar lactone lactonase YvrE
VTALVLGALAMLGTAALAQSPRARFDTRVLAHIPSPGFGALSLVAPDRTIYVGSFENPAGDSLPSKVFAFGPDGALRRTYTIAGQNLSQPHGVQVATIDGRGLLYLMDESPPRVLTLDPQTGVQTVYASFHDLPSCSPAAGAAECSDTVQDNAPEPDYAAWGPDGSMYVTDYQEATIWRVPPGGGAAHVWFTDPRLDGTMFGPAGIVLMPDQHTLLFDTAASAPSTGADYAQGKLFELPVGSDGRPGALRQLWESRGAEAPDGLALAASGNVYIALVGPGANQIVEVSPAGQEIARTPDPASNAKMAVPYDEPSSVQFDGERLIVTNLSYLAGDTSHQVLFDMFAGEPGAPVFHPAAAASAPGPTSPSASHPAPGAPARFRLTVSPRRVVAGRRVRLRFHAFVRRDARHARPLAGVRIRVAGRHTTTGRAGRASILLVLHRGGLVSVHGSRRGYRPAVVHVRARSKRTAR